MICRDIAHAWAIKDLKKRDLNCLQPLLAVKFRRPFKSQNFNLIRMGIILGAGGRGWWPWYLISELVCLRVWCRLTYKEDKLF